MIPCRLRGSHRWLGIAASLGCIALLAACRSTPPARSTGTGSVPVVEPPPDVEALQSKIAEASDVKIPVPPCVPEVSLPAPQPKPNPKPAPKEAPAEPPTPAIRASPQGVIDADVKTVGNSVASILGKRVQSPQGEDLGRVVDVLADGGGHVQLAIIDFGGFLGLGNRRIAVDWALLHFDPGSQDKPLTLSLSRAELQRAPEYKDSAHPQALMVPASTEGKK